MSDITCACAGEPEMSQFPCKATDYGFPTKIVLMSPNGTLAVAGDSPTLAEIQAGIADSGVNRLIVIEEMTNGQLIEANRQEETGADTADGLTTVVSINMAIKGKLKKMDEVLRVHLAELNCYDRLYAWVITSKGFIRGGKYGYKVANFIPPMIQDGFGKKALYDLSFEYVHNLNATDPMTQDDGFLLLQNTQTT